MAFDEQFILGDEHEPEIKACILHPMLPSVRPATAPEQGGFGGILYGLCSQCGDLLERFPRFQEVIDEEITERVKQLAKGAKS